MFRRIDNVLNGDKKCCIVIPTQKLTFSKTEIISIEQCFKIWNGKYDIFFATPEKNNFSFSNYTYNELKCDNKYFESIKGYNELCVTSEFYESFKDYEYMLIYQADCYVFYDRLDYFCELGYDYIGAPWPPYTVDINPIIGNGGFSLRKNNTFINQFKGKIEEFKDFASNRGNDRYEHNEDTFICISHKNDFKISELNVGMEFSFECMPNYFYSISKRIPMGCHAWDKNYNTFWKNYIKI